MSSSIYHCRLCTAPKPNFLPDLSYPCPACFPTGCWLLKPPSPLVNTEPDSTALIYTFSYHCARCQQVRFMRHWSWFVTKYTVEQVIPGDRAWKPMREDPNTPTHTCTLCFPWRDGMWVNSNTKEVRFEDEAPGPGEAEGDDESPWVWRDGFWHEAS